jgi:hypothetical protein
MVTTSVSNAPPEKASPDTDARDRATRRGIEYMEKDLKDAGGAYDIDELRHVLGGVSLREVDERVAGGSILEIRDENKRRRFPKMQFNDEGTVVAGLKSVSESFPSRSSWALLNFLVNPQDGLGGAKPIDLLRSGATQEVVAAAHRIGQQG